MKAKSGCLSLMAILILLVIALYGIIQFLDYEEQKHIPVEFRGFDKLKHSIR